MNLLKKPKRTALKLLAKTKKKFKKYRVWKNSYGRLNDEHVAYETSNALSYDAHGKGFMKHFPEQVLTGPAGRTYSIKRGDFSYESRFVLGIYSQNDARKIAHISLGFAKDTLIIEAMQTGKGLNNLLNEFRRVAKEKPIDKLLQEAEKTAKGLGFTQIVIRRPETQFYYHRPITDRLFSPAQEKVKQEEIRRQMKDLYRRIALKNGFKPEELFYVKQLV